MIRRILLVVALVAPTALVLNVSPADAGDCASSLTVADTTVGEGDGQANVAVSIGGGACNDGDTLDCTSADGTAKAGEDFTAVDTSIALDLFQTSANVPVPITDDEDVEENEQFTLTCDYGLAGGESASGGPSGYVFARGIALPPSDTGTVTITDNDEAAAATTTTAAPTTTTTTAAPTTTTAPPTITVVPDNVPPGGDTTVTGTGFGPGTGGTIFILSEPIQLATATADSEGVIRATVTIPEEIQPGVHTIEIRGVDSNGTPRTLSAPITVGEVTDTTAAAQPLAATGSGLSTLIIVAGVLAAAGGALLLQVRRRRTAGAS